MISTREQIVKHFNQARRSPRQTAKRWLVLIVVADVAFACGFVAGRLTTEAPAPPERQSPVVEELARDILKQRGYISE